MQLNLHDIEKSHAKMRFPTPKTLQTIIDFDTLLDKCFSADQSWSSPLRVSNKLSSIINHAIKQSERRNEQATLICSTRRNIPHKCDVQDYPKNIIIISLVPDVRSRNCPSVS